MESPWPHPTRRHTGTGTRSHPRLCTLRLGNTAATVGTGSTERCLILRSAFQYAGCPTAGYPSPVCPTPRILLLATWVEQHPQWIRLQNHGHQHRVHLYNEERERSRQHRRQPQSRCTGTPTPSSSSPSSSSLKFFFASSPSLRVLSLLTTTFPPPQHAHTTYTKPGFKR